MQTTEELAMAQACPWCKAAPGEKCIMRTGKGGMHYNRYKLGIAERQSKGS